MTKQVNAREVSKLIARLPLQSKRLGRLEALVSPAGMVETPRLQAKRSLW